MKDVIIQAIRKRINHEHISLVNRGNSAILVSLMKFATTVFAPSEGGWLTYKQYAKELNLDYVEIACQDAKIDLVDLKKKLIPGSVFIYHSLGAYCAQQDIQEIYQICKEKGCLVIMDVSGTFGTKLSDGKYADICLGSFGKWKLVNLGTGGFISFKDPAYLKQIKPLLSAFTFNGDIDGLLTKIDAVEDRISFLLEKRKEILTDLSVHKILHSNDSLGFVVIIPFSNETDRLRILAYCTQKGYEYTTCPRDIRVLRDAVSIEIKRLES